MPRFTARNRIVRELKENGRLKSIRPHPMKVPLCSRSGDVVEPMLKPQWFLKMTSMKEKVIDAVETGRIKIHPENYVNVMNNWFKEERDWCLSRQLWWGHRIPVWRHEDKWIAARNEDEAVAIAKTKYNLSDGFSLRREEDVLDTWFSSALLPFANFGWPNENSKDLGKHYPLSLMETGQDILFFWVTKMAMLGLELTGKAPFKEVLLHGLIFDKQGI